MSNSQQNQYLPDYLVRPGEILDDYLESLGMSQAELSDRTGLSKKTINEIVKGKSPITTETALKFERVLGRPAHFWNNLEHQFQEDRARLEEQARLQAGIKWLKDVPVAAMARLGFILKLKDATEKLEAVLRFFGIASPDQWETIYHDYQVAYRQTQRVQTCPLSVSAWLRQGEIEAQQIDCAPFDKARFREVLGIIRGLTTEEPAVFRPKLEELCASAGVAVVFVPELPKTGIYGATRWISGKAIIQLSLRYKSDDHLWFTFFHEAGHILKHGRKDVFLEGKGMDGEKEEEANAFARDFLIPAADFRRFICSWDGRSLAPIKSFARDIGIAPGIIVGRLQHEKKLNFQTGNKMKARYRWVREEDE